MASFYSHIWHGGQTYYRAFALCARYILSCIRHAYKEQKKIFTKRRGIWKVFFCASPKKKFASFLIFYSFLISPFRILHINFFFSVCHKSGGVLQFGLSSFSSIPFPLFSFECFSFSVWFFITLEAEILSFSPFPLEVSPMSFVSFFTF